MSTNFYFINFLDFGLMTIRSVDLDPASKNASFIPPEILLHQQVKKQKKCKKIQVVEIGKAFGHHLKMIFNLFF